MRNEPTLLVPTISPAVRGAVRVGVIQASPVRVGPAGPDLQAAMEELASSLASRHAGRAPGEIQGLRSARDLYHEFGVDPTRTRPSSEALLRRVLSGNPLPRILNAVDFCNLCSLRFLLPIGLYDANKIRGPVVLRQGESEESYPGIRKEAVHLRERLVLADDGGAFGNPTSDSLRTSVTQETARLFMVVFAPASFPRDTMESNVEFAKYGMARYLAPPGEAVVASGAVLP